jgi:hypothetical protein
LLKILLLAAAFALGAPLPGAAADLAPLVVGSVRDQQGAAVDGALIRAFDAQGSPVGSGRSDRAGTFAVPLSGQASRVDVSCRHCRLVSVSAQGDEPLAVIVERFTALESDVPEARDLSALPYQRIGDDLGLMPFVIPSADGDEVSELGLNHGQGLVLDDGAPAYDLSTGKSGLADFPGRYVRQISVIDPSHAFEYGSYAGGGTFALDQLDPQESFVSGDAGQAPSFAVEPSLGVLFPAVGVSNDGTLQRRADFDVDEPFAGGVLRTGLTEADEFDQPGEYGTRAFDLARIDYATASRRYRTFVDLDASGSQVTQGAAAPTDYRASYLYGAFRLEHPGPVSWTAGATLSSQSGLWTQSGSYPFAVSGNVTSQTAFVEAQSDGSVGGFFAGLGLARERDAQTTDAGAPFAGDQSALLPSLQGHLSLGGPFSLRAGVSTSLNVPTLLYSYADVPPQGSLVIERGKLQEAGLDYDAGGRLRVETVAFREDLRNIDDQRLVGIGASIVWQVAPDLSLRAWSLRDSPLGFENNEAPIVSPTLSRAVLWATYESPSGIRFDAIAHRDVNSQQVTELDGDALLPIWPRVSLDLGTFRRSDGRRYSVGLRFR